MSKARADMILKKGMPQLKGKGYRMRKEKRQREEEGNEDRWIAQSFDPVNSSCHVAPPDLAIVLFSSRRRLCSQSRV